MKNNQTKLNNSVLPTKINPLVSGGGVMFVNNISEQLTNTNFYATSKLTYNQNQTFTKLNTLDLNLVYVILVI